MMKNAVRSLFAARQSPGYGSRTLPALCGMFVVASANALQIDLPWPVSSAGLVGDVAVLPNGNFVVTDPYFDGPGPIDNIGAAFLYSPDGILISTLTGSRVLDSVGYGGVVVLENGNFVVKSPYWNHSNASNAGAATWGDAETGVSGVVSVDNSLIGRSTSDYVGSRVVALKNGNYVVCSSTWDNGAIVDAGAVVWGNGITGSSGVVSISNSLFGTSANDSVGSDGVTPLTNGHFVIHSPNWDNATNVNVGATTWASGNGVSSGQVSPSNSLVGSHADDLTTSRVLALNNGNYVVAIRSWDDGVKLDVGAVTWGNGVTGTSGQIGQENSLIGAVTGDNVGQRVTALSNGNYVVSSMFWDNGPVLDAGAVTWGDGERGTFGVVSSGNSMVGTSDDNQVGDGGATALTNGHYVICSSNWDNGAIRNVGAATWVDGTAAMRGVVGPSNSLIGIVAGDNVCSGATALNNGNYVVRSSNWDNGAIDSAGAVTWGDGSQGTVGVVEASNSLVGSSVGDLVGIGGVTLLTDGDYVVSSTFWDSGNAANAGAATWGNGLGGTVGLVSPMNSLVGSSAGDSVGGAVTALPSGNYLVSNSQWSNGTVSRAGALTWGNGESGTSGTINPGNSLVGGVHQDYVGSGVAVFRNGSYAVLSADWNNGAVTDSGAVTLGSADGSVIGPVNAVNSVLGATAFRGRTLKFGYDATRSQLVVARRWDNLITLFRPGETTVTVITQDTPDPSVIGQAVTILTKVSAVSAPSFGTVTVTASTGETCSDNEPSSLDSASAEFNCEIEFATVGKRTLRAEFYGTQAHGFSSSAPRPHVTVEDNAFADGFE